MVSPAPYSSGLILCDRIIIEERTRNASLIGTFTARRVKEVPCTLEPFCVFAMLTEGAGLCPIEIVVSHLETDREVSVLKFAQPFPDRLHAVRFIVRMERCRVVGHGTYEVALLSNGRWVARSTFRVLPAGQQT